jgi:glucosylceramidase
MRYLCETLHISFNNNNNNNNNHPMTTTITPKLLPLPLLLLAPLLLAVVAPLLAYPSSPPQVQVWLTLPDKSVLLQQQPSIKFEHTQQSSASSAMPPQPIGSERVTIQVNDNVRYQPIDGFGAALTDSSAYLMYQLRQSNRTAYNELLQRLFGWSTSDSIALNVIRLPSSASDFSLTNYTYDDTAGDTTLQHESIAHDEAYIIPVLRDIIQVAGSERIKIMSTPWTAPAWMKTSNSFLQGTLLPSMVC